MFCTCVSLCFWQLYRKLRPWTDDKRRSSVLQTERDDVRAARDGDVLFVVEHVGHRRGAPEVIGGETPEEFAGGGVDRGEFVAVGAEEEEASGRGEDAAASGGRAGLREFPGDPAGVNIDGAQVLFR